MRVLAIFFLLLSLFQKPCLALRQPELVESSGVEELHLLLGGLEEDRLDLWVRRANASDAFQKTLGDLVQTLVVEGNESAFLVNEEGRTTPLWRGSFTAVTSFGGIQKQAHFVHVHSHPSWTYTGSMGQYAVPYISFSPTHEDISQLQFSPSIPYGMIVLGEAGLGFYAVLFSGDGTIRGEESLLELHRRGARFYRLRPRWFQEFGPSVQPGRHAYRLARVPWHELFFFKWKVYSSWMLGTQNVRRQLAWWKQQGFERGQALPERELSEQIHSLKSEFARARDFLRYGHLISHDSDVSYLSQWVEFAHSFRRSGAFLRGFKQARNMRTPERVFLTVDLEESRVSGKHLSEMP